MRMAIIGGKLQGVEVAYLAREAGYETLLVDRNPRAPAAGLVDRCVSFDVTADRARLRRVVEGMDLIFPAVEDEAVLSLLAGVGAETGIPVALDLAAYRVSASKLESNALFDTLAIPMPRPYPACGMPVIAKPCFGSGSAGVRLFRRERDLEEFLAGQRPGDWCVQAFVEGPSYSLEVIGRPGDYQTLQVTELFVDDRYDCCRVVAPGVLPAGLVAEFRALTLAIAGALGLQGIMDVEVILAQGRFHVLEIDARFPSQTPIAVYHSTGINMVRMLADLFTGKPWRAAAVSGEAATLEHVRVKGNERCCRGEHMMAQYGPLRVVRGCFGAARAIVSEPGADGDWVATLIRMPNDLSAECGNRNAEGGMGNGEVLSREC